MSGMKKVILEKDYEQYRILLPVKFFMSGKRRKYISSQLEKLHPCFSDSFCFDTKYRLSKQGIIANVIVMDKLRLCNYKATYPHSPLTCEEKGTGFVFVGKKTKALLTALFCLPLLGLLFLFPAAKNGKQKQKEQNQIAESVCEPVFEIEEVETAFAYETFFGLLEGRCEVIDSLDWKYDGFTERLSISVKNCYPDVFSDTNAQTVSFSNINYVNDIPSFSMSVSNRKVADFGKAGKNVEAADFGKIENDLGLADFGKTPKDAEMADFGKIEKDLEIDSENDDFRGKIRDALKEKSIRIISENYLPYKIRFQISDINIEENCLNAIEEISKSAGWSVNEISLNASAENSLDAEISFTNDFCYSAEKSILDCIGKSWEIFSVKKRAKQTVTPQVKTQLKPQVASNTPPKEIEETEEETEEDTEEKTEEETEEMLEKKHLAAGDKKIGTITRPNGEKIVFYKSAKGAIIYD